MATVKENLIAAKALIADPEMWGKGEDRDCFCAVVAIGEVVNMDVDRWNSLCRVLGAALPASFDEDAWDWNDPVAQFNDLPETTHADIMALFDRAIAAQGDAISSQDEKGAAV